jgi:peptidoglycan hydrolase-like protein with peptidoglycan-binding domain
VLSFRASLAMVFTAAAIAAPAYATPTHHTTTAHSAHRLHGRASSHKASRRVRGQQAIEPERVTEIQQALIREHYLNGEANGQWNSETQSAMQKFQSDQGWQTRIMPDSRALKKLGLGPDYSTAINAKGSTFADPPPSSTIPSPQAEGFATASGASHEN